jgi:hypothetical protein
VYDPQQLWIFLPIGYLLTVAFEAPILYFGLSRRHAVLDRVIAGFWLTAVTYPIVVIVLPLWIGDRELFGLDSRTIYLTIAETFAPAAECGLFYAAYIRPRATADRLATLRDFGVIIVANLASFLVGGMVVERLRGVLPID